MSLYSHPDSLTLSIQEQLKLACLVFKWKNLFNSDLLEHAQLYQLLWLDSVPLWHILEQE